MNKTVELSYAPLTEQDTQVLIEAIDGFVIARAASLAGVPAGGFDVVARKLALQTELSKLCKVIEEE